MAAALAFALTFGFNFGIGSQVCYLVPSLRLLDPSLFVNDWYATRATHYHPVFAYLAAPLLAVDPDGWALSLGSTVAVTVAALCLYSALRASAGPRLALPAFLLLVTFAMLTRTRGPLHTYVFDEVFQPWTLASAALIAAVPFFVRERFFAAGACAAASMAFHLSLVPLLFAGFGLAQMLLGRIGLGKRLAVQLALPALVLTAFLPLMLRATRAEPGAEWARDVFLYVRNGHHFALAENAREFLPLIAWQLIALGTVRPLAARPDCRELGRLLVFAEALCLVVWGGALASAISPRLAVNFSWRLSAHAELLLQAATSVALLRLLAEPASRSAHGAVSLALCVLGGSLAFVAYATRGRAALFQAFVIVAVAAAALLVVAPRVRRGYVATPGVLAAASGLLLVGFGIGPLSRIRIHSTLLAGLPADEVSLSAWIRSSTPKDAVFVTPPDMGGMRLHARRAIVVDWKAVPGVLSEVVEWYGRLQAVTGRRELRGPGDLDGYAELDAARLDVLRARYGVRYAVVRRAHARALDDYPRAFSNATFEVLALDRRSSDHRAEP